MKLVIKQHRPVRRALLVAAIAAGVVAIVGLALDYGHWQSFARTLLATGRQRTLVDEIARLKDDNAALRYELTRVRRTEEINKFARRDTHAEWVHLQSQVAALNRELTFYRDVVGASEVESGPKVKGIQIKSLDGKGGFSYRLVLTHLDENDLETEGTLRIGVRGELKGEHKVLSFDQLVASGPDTLAFKFKHFHMFEGTLQLPDGFIPRQISVAVQSKIPLQSSLAETYDWASVLN